MSRATPFLALALAACLTEPVDALDWSFDTETGRLKAERIVEGLEYPWGVAFLPNGGMLVTERPGRLRLVSPEGQLSEPIRGVPEVRAQGQGGLLDVAVHPQFGENSLVYLTFSEPGEGGAGTSVARGRLNGDALQDVQIIFRQEPKVDGANHFGSRLVFDRDGALFVALGERFKFEPSQDLASHLGKIVRILPDGAVPPDNPFVGRADAKPEIWSYGHRNIQGAALHPETGVLWVAEHGPRGGDELNVVEGGRNYGWPAVSWGDHYSGERIPNPPTRPEMTPPIHHWSPAIAPSGMAFYTGDLLPRWRGNALIGGLNTQGIIRLTLDGERVTGEERIPLGSPVRDVRQGPDDAIYVLTHRRDGALLRISPADERG